MTSNSHTTIQVLVIRDELPTDNEKGVQQTDALADEPRLSVTVVPSAYGEGLRAARRVRPDVILVDGVLGGSTELVAELDEAVPRIPLLAILDEPEAERIHECMVAGARACLVRPVEIETLVQTIFQLHEKALKRRKLLLEEGGGQPAGYIVAVRGAKGGVGTTVIATNLAVAIKQRSGQRVALVDAHFFGGDVPVALDMAPENSFGDLIPHLESLDDELLESTLNAHSSGVQVLAAPTDLERAEAITPEGLQRVLEALRSRFDYIVVDGASFLDQNSLLVLDMADLFLLVCTPELTALKNAARFVQLGIEFGYSEAKMRLVVNRKNGAGAIERSDMERHLQYGVSFSIPNDGAAVVRALNRGLPVVSFDRSSGVAHALQRLARVVIANEGWEVEPGRGRRRLIRLPSLTRLSPRLGARKATAEQAR